MRWYFAADGAQALTYDTQVRFPIWDSDLYLPCEKPQLRRDRCAGAAYLGTAAPIGEPAWYLNGVPANLVGPPEVCCDDCD